MNLANKITITRILLIPFFIACVLYAKWELALLTFVLAAISDAADGFIARRRNEKTELGKILDPIADKLLIISAFICLSLAGGLPPAVKPPVYVLIAILSREAIIFLGAIVTYYIKGRLEGKSTVPGKITTFFQMVTIISILLRLEISPILWNIAVVFTIISGVDYIIKGSRFLNGK